MKTFTLLVFASCLLLINTEGDKPTTDAAVPRYIRELYDNFTRENSSIETIVSQTTNSIRSLQNTAPESQCGVFRFSLSGIGNHELTTKSELHLYMNRHTSSNTSLYVVIKKYETEKDELEYVTAQEVGPSKGPGWLVFEIQSYVAKQIQRGAENVAVKVQIDPQISGNRDMDCSEEGPISFVNSPTDEDKAPFLTVESYDNRINLIDYMTILKKIDSQPSNVTTQSQRRRRQTQFLHSHRRKRSTHPRIPACRANDLIVNTSAITPSLRLEGTIILPVTYDAKICGGACGYTRPRYVEHSQLVHYWVTSKNFERPPYKGLKTMFRQFCAPVEYSSLMVIFKPKDKPAHMLLLRNMVIANCDCLEVAEFS